MFSIGGDVEAFDLSKLDPIIVALLHHLPPKGKAWPATDRALWISLLEQSLKMVFPETSSVA